MTERTVRISGVTIDHAGNITATHDEIVTVSDPPIRYAPDEPAEVAYWHFDALRSGDAKECRVDETTRAPVAERDAFKRIVRPLYDAIAELVDFAEGVAISRDAHPFFKNEARNVSRLRALLGRAEES